MTPRSADELVDLLKRECELREQNIVLARAGSILLVLTILALSLFDWIRGNGFPGQTLTDLSPFFLVAFGGVALTANHRQALLVADADQDPRLVGYLIEALEYGKKIADHAERKLTKALLSRPGLTIQHRRILAERLSNSRNSAFVEAALVALRPVGGNESIEGLERLTTPKSAHPVRVESMALQALADIRIRVARSIIEDQAQSAYDRGDRPREVHERVQPNP